ncbi:unnamed protein product, partial [Laminaria digitata]
LVNGLRCLLTLLVSKIMFARDQMHLNVVMRWLLVSTPVAVVCYFCYVPPRGARFAAPRRITDHVTLLFPAQHNSGGWPVATPATPGTDAAGAPAGGQRRAAAGPRPPRPGATSPGTAS